MRRLDHEHAVALRDRQAPATLGIRHHHIAAVRDHYAGDAGIAGHAPAGPATVVENPAACDGRPLRKPRARCQRQRRRAACSNDLPSRRPQPRSLVVPHRCPFCQCEPAQFARTLCRVCDLRVTNRCGLRDSSPAGPSSAELWRLHSAFTRSVSTGLRVTRCSAGGLPLRDLGRLVHVFLPRAMGCKFTGGPGIAWSGAASAGAALMRLQEEGSDTDRCPRAS